MNAIQFNDHELYLIEKLEILFIVNEISIYFKCVLDANIVLTVDLFRASV